MDNYVPQYQNTLDAELKIIRQRHENEMASWQKNAAEGKADINSYAALVKRQTEEIQAHLQKEKVQKKVEDIISGKIQDDSTVIPIDAKPDAEKEAEARIREQLLEETRKNLEDIFDKKT